MRDRTVGDPAAVTRSDEQDQARVGKQTLVTSSELPRLQLSDSGANATITPPTPGINQVGFIDHGDGSNIRTGPAEAGGQMVRPEPLPPATRVFVSGRHPSAAEWWYVTAFLDDAVVRGYVQHFRVTTDLPEPMAELYQVQSGDTAEALASRKFAGAVRDGHDLRYYENVLLYVNRLKNRAGVTGSYQDPNLLGGGANNVQLVAGHRIWLPSAAYARTLEQLVPDGSFTNGAVAGLNRFAGHLEDVLRSVRESPGQFEAVAGEYADAIREHLTEILGVVAVFLAAEALSLELAATPAGVTQIAAAVIQLILALLGAQALVAATVEAVQHAASWLSTAWNANGDARQIASASRDFIRMLVSIALAVLAYLGMRGNLRNAIAIGNNLPPPPLAPAYATVGGGSQAGGAAVPGVAIGPSAGSAGAGGAVLMSEQQDQDAQGPAQPTSGEPAPIYGDSGRQIGEFSRGNWLKMMLSRGRQLFGGNTIELEAGRTTTVTGTLDDVNAVAQRGLDPTLAVTRVGENPGGINILRSPRWGEIQAELQPLLASEGELAYWRAVTDRFWREVNQPWIEAAVARGDAIRFVSNPLDELKTFVTNGAGELVLDGSARIRSIFGREIDYLLSNGYRIDGATAVRTP